MKNYALSLTSAFSTTSLLKARIMMLYRKPSAKFALAKFGFALPALALCIVVSACSSSWVGKVENILITKNEKKKVKLFLQKGNAYSFTILPEKEQIFQHRNLIKYELLHKQKTILYFGTITDNQFNASKSSQIIKPSETGYYWLFFENYSNLENVVFQKKSYPANGLKMGKHYTELNGKPVDMDTVVANLKHKKL
jgi:sporulation protein YlmC with PRC-barrel domain